MVIQCGGDPAWTEPGLQAGWHYPFVKQAAGNVSALLNALFTLNFGPEMAAAQTAGRYVDAARTSSKVVQLMVSILLVQYVRKFPQLCQTYRIMEVPTRLPTEKYHRHQSQLCCDHCAAAVLTDFTLIS